MYFKYPSVFVCNFSFSSIFSQALRRGWSGFLLMCVMLMMSSYRLISFVLGFIMVAAGLGFLRWLDIQYLASDNRSLVKPLFHGEL